MRLRRVSLKSMDPDDIHDLRVASRRFRAILELLYPFAPKGQKTYLRKKVRKLTQVLGGLRNIDEAELFFQSRASGKFSIGSTLCHTLAKLRASEFVRIKKALKEFDQGKMDAMVQEIVAELADASLRKRNGTSLLAYLSEVSIRQYLPIHRLLSSAAIPERRTSRHSLRIAIKKWRYFFEIITQILGCDYTRTLELLKEYQSILGQMNDIAEFELLLAPLKLPREERAKSRALLKAEDARLLACLEELIEHKPLAYTFLL
ncbi:MAG: CHAD domain-containing protein [Desulfuromonadaceae bacterium]|nr:CHAD domain-containing protein [Desulfuromonadaceae bacterium]